MADRVPLAPIDYDDLDIGVRRTVRWLRERGFNTCDSGDGVSKKGTPLEPCMNGDTPNVLIVVDEPGALAAECNRLRDALIGVGVDVLPCDDGDHVWIQGNYDPSGGHALIMLIGMLDRMLPDA